MPQHTTGRLDRIALGLGLLYLADRAAKFALLTRYFSLPAPPEPSSWPSVTILEPVTAGSNGLRANLEARAHLAYPANVRHVLICDAADMASRATCRKMVAAHPELDIRTVLVQGEPGAPAPKLVKLQAGMPHATGDVLCLMDDDVAPRPDALRRLVAYLGQPGVGASYGLACYTNWDNLWSSLLSSYVNAFTLENFIAWDALCGPVRIVGQMACYWRRPFTAAGGFDGLEGYLDDDFVLAQRLSGAHLRAVQAPVVYDVDDGAATRKEYAAKFQRWIVLPRHTMEPFLTARQRYAAFFATPATILLPSILGGLALLTRRTTPLVALGASLSAFAAVQRTVYTHFLHKHMSLRQTLSLPYTALVTPIHAALSLLAGNEVVWRGQRLRVYKDGQFERVA